VILVIQEMIADQENQEKSRFAKTIILLKKPSVKRWLFLFKV